MDYFSLVDKIIELRKNKGISQERLAELTSISRCTLARIETKKNIPKIDTFLKIVKALDCKILLDSV